jgi:predicted component of type VI protein secretion system
MAPMSHPDNLRHLGLGEAMIPSESYKRPRNRFSRWGDQQMASLRITQHAGISPGQRIPLDIDGFVIGRNPDCQLVIPSFSVSRQHAQLRLQGGKWYIEDMRTRHGTWVNNQQILSQTLLNHNDEIRLPDFRAVFESV